MNASIVGTWPNSELTESQAVVSSVVRCYAEMVSSEEFPDLFVWNDPNRTFPLASYDMLQGRELVFLCVKQGNLWAQIAYQLSHELNHIHANFRLNQNHAFKWLEESLCELASWCNMNWMSEVWGEQSSKLHWKSYARHLKEYVEHVKAKTEIPSDFKSWLRGSLPALMTDQYDRASNRIIAHELLSIFDSDPYAWVAISQLNTWKFNTQTTLEQYLDQWGKLCSGDSLNALSKIQERLV